MAGSPSVFTPRAKGWRQRGHRGSWGHAQTVWPGLGERDVALAHQADVAPRTQLARWRRARRPSLRATPSSRRCAALPSPARRSCGPRRPSCRRRRASGARRAPAWRSWSGSWARRRAAPSSGCRRRRGRRSGCATRRRRCWPSAERSRSRCGPRRHSLSPLWAFPVGFSKLTHRQKRAASTPLPCRSSPRSAACTVPWRAVACCVASRRAKCACACRVSVPCGGDGDAGALLPQVAALQAELQDAHQSARELYEDNETLASQVRALPCREGKKERKKEDVGRRGCGRLGRHASL